MNDVKTLVIDNFVGKLTRYNDGDINSGYAKYSTSFGYNPFVSPGNLTWFEAPIRVDSGGTIITDVVMAAKERVETDVLYVYAIGRTGRLYKIKVNDPGTGNANFDTPTLLATLSDSSPTFNFMPSLDFYGSTERIYVGHDKGVTMIDFNGTGETIVGSFASYQQNCPRPLRQFLGKLYFGNGSNIGEINETTVNTYAKLTPSFPTNTQVQDIDLSSDGNYLQIVVSRLAIRSVATSTTDSARSSNIESYVFKWNGIDMGYTALDIFPSSLMANTTFGNNQYTFGYDFFGGAMFNPIEKAISTPLVQSPYPNAISANSNLVLWTAPEAADGFLKASNFLFGGLDNEVGTGLWRLFRMSSTSPQTDVIRTPFQLLVANHLVGESYSTYTGEVFGSGKIYFSTYEDNTGGQSAFRFFKFLLTPTGGGTAIAGVYETQTQLFSKKVTVKEVRLYAEPFVANNAFTVELIGSDGDVISGSSKTFTTGTDMTAGEDTVLYNPAVNNTYAIGLRITNSGSVNWVCQKAEIDYAPGGKK